MWASCPSLGGMACTWCPSAGVDLPQQCVGICGQGTSRVPAVEMLQARSLQNEGRWKHLDVQHRQHHKLNLSRNGELS